MTKTIEINHITKIEGHAALKITLKKGEVDKCELSSIEGARYFEQLLVGRDYSEAFQISSRICGICSCAHTVTAIMAIENALGMTASKQTFQLRELLTLGERIRSHVTHLHFLALPDYLGYESAMAMLPKYKKEVKRALRLMKLGNHIVKIIGGRDLHPVSAAVGGFVGFPSEEEIRLCLDDLEARKKDAIQVAKLFMKLKSPDFSREVETFSLKYPKEYGMLRGSLVSGEHTYKQVEFSSYMSEYHETHSTAKFVVKEGKEYRLGALSRLNNDAEGLSDDAKKLLKASKISLPSFNPFCNNIAQAIEVVHAIDHSIAILSELQIKREPLRKPILRAGKGIAAVEVPRGILWHEYELDKKGKIKNANIITPTTQNLRCIQEDIRGYLPSILHLPKEQIILEIEKLIRSYDPCFSCGTHFLDVEWEEK